jgi:hypothetical protein
MRDSANDPQLTGAGMRRLVEFGVRQGADEGALLFVDRERANQALDGAARCFVNDSIEDELRHPRLPSGFGNSVA